MVEVEATERSPAGGRVRLDAGRYGRLAHSNIPGLLLVADAKHDALFFAWPPPGLAAGADRRVPVAVRPLDDAARAELRAVLTGGRSRAAAPDLAAAA